MCGSWQYAMTTPETTLRDLSPNFSLKNDKLLSKYANISNGSSGLTNASIMLILVSD